ncbi:MAG TPA: hypothetical protein VHE61_17530 [Opitutaceae bacterium]|nr:hypothetical protein [Opitutaceae bacterium]
MTPRDEQNLEQLINTAVRHLPTRPAPRSLELRVQAEIARRAALPWWRKSYTHWPVAARAAFVVLCVAAGTLGLVITNRVDAGILPVHVQTAFAPAISWLHGCAMLLQLVATYAQELIGKIPPLWLYGGAAIVASLYLALFSLGAAAYRTLYAHR